MHASLPRRLGNITTSLLSDVRRAGGYSTQRRLLSGSASTVSSKLQAALRPFIFSVHPDLFGQYPHQKSTNEASLKALNEYIQHGDSTTRLSQLADSTLKFYQRVEGGAGEPGDLRLIKVRLTPDVLQTVKTLLESNDLSTDSVTELIESVAADGKPDRPINWIQSNYFAATGKKYPFVDVWDELTQLRPAVTLHRWVKVNIERARRLERENAQLRRDCEALRTSLERSFSLSHISWACGWRGAHQLAALKSLQKLLETEPAHRAVLKDRGVVFGTEGGTSMNGDVILCSEEVPQQWSKMLKSVSSSDKYLALIPGAESQLSGLLAGIQIVRRTSLPIPSAELYYSSLAGLVGRFGMAFDISHSRKADLSHLQISVSGSMGDELTMTPEGHINVPCHSPVWAINNFIRDNEEAAVKQRSKYLRDKTEAERLMKLVRQEFALQSLRVDNSVTYDQAIQCCANLLMASGELRFSLEQLRLCIAPFFSVMNDGEVCILWNWVSEA